MISKIARSPAVWRILRYMPARLLWAIGTELEVRFWAGWLDRKPDNFWERMKPKKLPKEFKNVKSILDVGSGPISRFENISHSIKLTAVDPLADRYCDMLEQKNIYPMIFPFRIAAENLTSVYKENSFDLVFCQNALDHSWNPEKAIKEMLSVAKSVVILKHRIGEAETQRNVGLHQWSFYIEGGEPILKKGNYKRRIRDIAQCEHRIMNDSEGEWLTIEMRK